MSKAPLVVEFVSRVPSEAWLQQGVDQGRPRKPVDDPECNEDVTLSTVRAAL